MKCGRRDARAPIAEVVSRVLAVVRRTPAGSALDWKVDVPADATGRIDADDLAEAIGNLVDNAARHARAKVSVEARREAGLVVIAIGDDGPGIPQERLDEALSRGGRLDRLGSGAGLGLAIVRDIADSWGCRFDIRSGADGLMVEFGVRG